ncbi:MAG: hypothetical protein NHG36_04275, partial [Chromatiaceae bacterium]|nr:hypothetical protein [Candidatus Thioaporhodococcus sediminis]
MNTPSYRSPLQPPCPRGAGERHQWGRLYGSSAALAMARAAEQGQRLVVALTPDVQGVARLTAELVFFL